MKKRFFAATLTFAIGFSTFNPVATDVQPLHVSAAVVNPQNNDAAVEAKANQLIQTAKSLIGQAIYSNTEYKPTYPYKFSCATFLMYIFEKNGVDLATYNEDYMMQQGVPVSRDQLQKGDLLFFDSRGGKIPNHVAMYIGNNQVIHMADPQQKIVISDLNSKPYYTDAYITARRVLPTLLPSNPATVGDQIVADAYQLKNTKQYNGTGFIAEVFKRNSVQFGTTDLQQLMSKGTTVSRSNLKKGDLVFFSNEKGATRPSLVAIYAGDHRIIVPTASGVETRVLFVDYYNQRYLTAKRVTSANVSAPSTAKQVTSANVSTPPLAKNALPADQVVNLATSLIGKATFATNTYNENSFTFTSAGFTYYIYKQQGIDLTSKLASRQAEIGKPVMKNSLQKGDLLFFSTDHKGTRITQTGIYIGNDQFISLPMNGKAMKESLRSTWAQQNFITARRVL